MNTRPDQKHVSPDVKSAPSYLKYLTSTLVASAVVLLSACSSDAQNTQAAPAPTVSVAPVIHQNLTEWDEFTGRLQAPETVELRPRVSGYVEQVNLREGAIVKAGDLLFQIDERSFKAEVARLEAELASTQSNLTLTELQFQRAKRLSLQKAISEEILDNRRAAYQQARAAMQSVDAALELARLNLSYTKVTAPIDGRVSNALVTKGNYVNAGQSILTSLVSTDTVYAYFDADEQTYLNYVKLARDGSRPSSRDVKNPVYMALANDSDYPHEGYIDFVDNRVDPRTGTIRGRAVFANTEGVFIPGLFARIKLVGSASYDGILIDDKAIGTDLNNKYVLVVDADNITHYRAVSLGEKLAGLRIIKSGLQENDRIVVKGLQRVRPGTPVTVETVSMTDEATLQDLQAMQDRIDRSLDKHHYVHQRIAPESAKHAPVNPSVDG